MKNRSRTDVKNPARLFGRARTPTTQAYVKFQTDSEDTKEICNCWLLNNAWYVSGIRVPFD